MNEVLQDSNPSEAPATIGLMWQVLVVCSGCAEESEVLVEELDEVDREVCSCGYSYVVLTVSGFEAVYAEQAQVIEMPRRRRKLPAAA